MVPYYHHLLIGSWLTLDALHCHAMHCNSQLWEDVEETSRVLKRLGYITYQVNRSSYPLLLHHRTTSS